MATKVARWLIGGAGSRPGGSASQSFPLRTRWLFGRPAAAALSAGPAPVGVAAPLPFRPYAVIRPMGLFRVGRVACCLVPLSARRSGVALRSAGGPGGGTWRISLPRSVWCGRGCAANPLQAGTALGAARVGSLPFLLQEGEKRPGSPNFCCISRTQPGRGSSSFFGDSCWAFAHATTRGRAGAGHLYCCRS